MFINGEFDMVKAINKRTKTKIDRLIHGLTIEEKVSLVSGADNFNTKAITRLGIPAIGMTDGPHGVRFEDKSGMTVEGNCYPTGSALGATWNTELVEQVAAAMAEETREKGCSILLGPCVNIHRSPIGGRNFESFSEDPYLAARLAVAYINGVQSREVAACVKHFALNNSEYQRFTISSEASERAMREIYLPAFEAAIKEAKSMSLMSSYNRVNGEYASENVWLLSTLLKEEWSFDGSVISDWYGTHSTVPMANAGLDVEMPGPARHYGDVLLDAVRNGSVSVSVINDKVNRLLTLMDKIGVLASPRKPLKSTSDTPRRHEIARQSAREAMVLLKNDGDVLPLRKSIIKQIVVIGPNAAKVCTGGAGSSRVRPYYRVQPLDALRKQCAPVQMVYEPGCKISLRTAVINPEEFRSISGKEPGLTGQYFTSRDLSSKPFQTRVDSSLSLLVINPQGNLSSVPTVNHDTFSARWTGTFIPQESGKYKFGVTTSGRGQVNIDGKLLIDTSNSNLPGQSRTGSEVTAEFRARRGQSYNIKVEYNIVALSSIQNFRLGYDTPSGPDLLRRAVAAAAKADIAIVVAGLTEEWEGEGFDRENMELPMKQDELIESVAAVNKKTVVVLNNGSPLAMHKWLDKVAAVLEMWFAGQECGTALAEILFGKVNPSGRLPMTFPKRLEDNPAFINYPGENGKVYYGEGIFVGYRYYDKKQIEPLFPFGHGLSYTNFEYANLRVEKGSSGDKTEVHVKVDVTNTGRRSGSEVAQFYVCDVQSSLMRPPKELKGFKKVFLKPGETKEVSINLDNGSFSYYDPSQQGWVMEPGEFRIMAGRSTGDIRAVASIIL
ncbi:MAG: glycoside hydrolase family 3 C-terminal domain-containing protein [Dehalococcoidales bacterium]|nr:glycoside hydrolase family 3 C-terminal domain-containing protein [Dehalococcoidales bacterium]